MALEHEAEYDALMQELLCGEVSADDPRVVAMVAASEERRMQVEQLSGLAARLDAAAKEQRSVLSEVDGVSLQAD